MHVQHINMMQWEQQSINTKPNSKHHKTTRKQTQSKTNKTRFSQKECLLPLGICISPKAFSPYECAWGRIFPPKNVHMSHIEMTILTGILSGVPSPFLSRIDKWIKRNERKKEEDMNKDKRWCMRGVRWKRKWGTKEKMRHKSKTKHKEHDMLRIKEQDIVWGMTRTQEHVICAKRYKKT